MGLVLSAAGEENRAPVRTGAYETRGRKRAGNRAQRADPIQRKGPVSDVDASTPHRYRPPRTGVAHPDRLDAWLTPPKKNDSSPVASPS